MKNLVVKFALSVQLVVYCFLAGSPGYNGEFMKGVTTFTWWTRSGWVTYSVSMLHSLSTWTGPTPWAATHSLSAVYNFYTALKWKVYHDNVIILSLAIIIIVLLLCIIIVVTTIQKKAMQVSLVLLYFDQLSCTYSSCMHWRLLYYVLIATLN